MNESVMNQLASFMGSQTEQGAVVELPAEAPFDDEQRQWLSGLLTGMSALAEAAAAGPAAEAPGTPLTILYGSQSGNCEVLSKDLKKFAATQGFDATITELGSTSLEDIAQMQHVLVLCSTFGEGEPPDDAKNFYQSVMDVESGVTLPATVNYSVCGLGDSTYTFFNQCAIDIDKRFAEMGATPCHEMISCDTAFEDDYAEWKSAVFETDVFKSAAGSSVEVAGGDVAPLYSKNTPFIANQIDCYNLSGETSAKRVNHISISLAGGGEDMHYDVGDALGVWPLNCPDEVAELLDVSGFTGREIIQQKTGPATLKVLLMTKLDIHTVNAKALEAWGITDAADDFEVYDVMDNLKPGLDPQTFVDGLRPLQPRLYSIASSPKKHPGEVHLSIGELRYDLRDKARKGVASTWLGNRLPIGSNMGVYIQASAHFHITSDDEAPVIMIGPGTGIAPFRAFLEEREMREAKGDNWLFFGDQHEATDFLYKDEIAGWQASGVLNQTSLAWSRDTDKKVYVQTLIKEQAETFYQWLESGAYIYICGDASRMAADVDTAIREVIAEQGGHDEAGVEAYMDSLTSAHRYQRDVY